MGGRGGGQGPQGKGGEQEPASIQEPCTSESPEELGLKAMEICVVAMKEKVGKGMKGGRNEVSRSA